MSNLLLPRSSYSYQANKYKKKRYRLFTTEEGIMLIFCMFVCSLFVGFQLGLFGQYELPSGTVYFLGIPILLYYFLAEDALWFLHMLVTSEEPSFEERQYEIIFQLPNSPKLVVLDKANIVDSTVKWEVGTNKVTLTVIRKKSWFLALLSRNKTEEINFYLLDTSDTDTIISRYKE